MRTIPLAFCISFKGTAKVYEETWKFTKKILKDFDIDFEDASFISDQGGPEQSALKKMFVFLSFLCWFHILTKCFIPRMASIDEDNKKLIIKKIRNIYCAKTYARRSSCVKTI